MCRLTVCKKESMRRWLVKDTTPVPNICSFPLTNYDFIKLSIKWNRNSRNKSIWTEPTRSLISLRAWQSPQRRWPRRADLHDNRFSSFREKNKRTSAVMSGKSWRDCVNTSRCSFKKTTRYVAWVCEIQKGIDVVAAHSVFDRYNNK